MPTVAENIRKIQQELDQFQYELVAVSKTKPNNLILEAYEMGHRHFGENKVQDLVDKQSALPSDICWHMIGHLQSNKVKYIAPFVHLIHGVDSLKLLRIIQKEALKNSRTIDCLLQTHIAEESTKFGFDETEVIKLIEGEEIHHLTNIRIVGLMGMATNTSNESQIRKEFQSLKNLFDHLKDIKNPRTNFQVMSMGMSSDYRIALEEGSNMIRVGSSIFGARDYA